MNDVSRPATPWAALIWIPIPVVLVYFFIMLRFLPNAGGGDRPPQPASPLVYAYLLFALPAAYIAEAVLYLSAYRRTPRRLVPFLIVAAIVGAIVGTLGPKLMLSLPDGATPPGDAVLAFGAGALSGALAGFLFWLAVRGQDPQDTL